MSLPVDRPWPVDHEYRGVPAKIDFQWGDPDDAVPKGLRISVKNDDSPVLYSRERAIYGSFDEAVAKGRKLAENEIDRFLGPE
ncbi:hypothetical protein [Pseudomonas graminis]|uniref:hypothetical protein n=1 Tax=Pseudomonas graminis TaxID=158627 RepID=UPI003C17DC13